MTIQDQIKEAILLLKGMFANTDVLDISMPTTLEEAKTEILQLRKELQAYKRIKRGVKPKVQDAVKLILEDERLTGIPVPTIAEVIRGVFKAYGLECACKEASIRWYISQFNLSWDIKQRKQATVPMVEVEDGSQE